MASSSSWNITIWWYRKFFNNYPIVAKYYNNILGLLSNYGVHAGAQILLPDTVSNYASTLKINGLETICYDGRTCEKLGFLKNDMLGLSTLTIIQDCLNLIEGDISFPSDLNDPKVYDIINQSIGGYVYDKKSLMKMEKKLFKIL